MQRTLPTKLVLALLAALALLGLVENVQRVHAQDDQPSLTALIADPYEPNNDPAHATPMDCDDTREATIYPAGDVDYFRFTGLAGELIVADIDAWINGSPLDSVLTLFDSDGTTMLDENDDLAWGTYDAHIEASLPHDGTFYLRVQDWFNEGGTGFFYALSLVCNGPREIGVTPNPFEVNLSPGQSETRTLTIGNSGPGTLNWSVSEQDNGPAPHAFTSLTGTVRILSWVRYTAISYLNVSYAHTLDAVEQYFSDFTVTESNTLDPAALAAALVGKDVLLLPQPDRATSAELEAAGGALQATLLAFVSSGHIIIATSEWRDYQGFLRSAALLDVQYSNHCAAGCIWTLPVVDPGHPLAVGLGATVQGANSTTSYVIGDSDVQVVVTDPDGHPVVAARDIGTGHVVLIGYDYYTYNNDAARIIADAVQWAQTRVDVPWLSAVPASGSVTGPGSQDVMVTFDAAGLAAGTHTANLLIFNDDPDEILVTVPVTFTVSPVLPGDLDGDCDVDVVDIMLVAGRWGATLGDPRYDSRYDLDLDGDIDVVDIMQVAAHWGEACNGAAGVPQGVYGDDREIEMRTPLN